MLFIVRAIILALGFTWVFWNFKPIRSMLTGTGGVGRCLAEGFADMICGVATCGRHWPFDTGGGNGWEFLGQLAAMYTVIIALIFAFLILTIPAATPLQ